MQLKIFFPIQRSRSFQCFFFFHLVPHSNDQTQPSDIGILAIKKYKKYKMTVPESLSQQLLQLIGNIYSFTQSTTFSNIMFSLKIEGTVTSYDRGRPKIS